MCVWINIVYLRGGCTLLYSNGMNNYEKVSCHLGLYLPCFCGTYSICMAFAEVEPPEPAAAEEGAVFV